MIQSRFFHALILGLCSLVILASVTLGVVRHLLATPSRNTEPVLLYIQKGQAVGQVAKTSHDLGLVTTPWHFKLVVRLKGLDRVLYSGEYEIAPKQSLDVTLDQIKRRNVYLRRIVVPEGRSVPEVMALLQNAFGLNMDGATAPKEGSLLPDTYFYERGDSGKDLLSRMKQAMSDVLVEAWNGRAQDLPFNTIQDALILASIVEKETGVAEERPMVAAVFANRLKKGMRLQSDPTVIYGITGGLPLDRLLSRKDLQQVTAYNTYRTGGLPPTPIANPGRDSIYAVMNPASVPYLYFVADGSGGHAFATSLQEHNRNVTRWRQIERSRAAVSQ